MAANGESTPSAREGTTAQWSLLDLIPTDWGFGEGRSAVWVAGFRLLLARPEDLPSETPWMADVLDCRVFWAVSGLTYMDAGSTEIEPWPGRGPIQVTVTEVGERSFEGCMLIVAHPFPSESTPADEPAVRAVVEEAVAVIRLLLGRNAAYENVFHNVVFPDGRRSASTDSFENPDFFGPPALSEQWRLGLVELGNAVQAAGEEGKPVAPALWWLNQSVGRSGVDAFIFLWVALETLIMKDHRDVASVTAALGRRYSLDPEGAAKLLMLDTLAFLRGRILHDGARPPIHGDILTYMEALFFDILQDVVGTPGQLRAKPCLDDTEAAQALAEAKAACQRQPTAASRAESSARGNDGRTE